MPAEQPTVSMYTDCEGSPGPHPQGGPALPWRCPCRGMTTLGSGAHTPGDEQAGSGRAVAPMAELCARRFGCGAALCVQVAGAGTRWQ